MCASYARQHQRKSQGSLNSVSSTGGGDQPYRRMTSEERKNLVGDKDAYLEYLESQLDKVCQHSIAENPQTQRRITELEESIASHEEKFANMTKLIKLLQTFAEAQEDENRLVKEQMNKPLSLLAKKMDSLQSDVAGDLNQKFALFEEKEAQREVQIFEALASFQNSIHDFENKIESFANQLSHDMASDIKNLAAQVQGQDGVQLKKEGANNVSGEMDGLLKKGLEKIREEVNRKIDYVMKEMRKNALVSDVEGFEEKIKKEQKERTYLCKFVEDLTRKIDDLAPSLASRRSPSRSLSPNSVAQDSNQFKLIRQVESDIEDLKEVVNALVDKIEDSNKISTAAFVTTEQFKKMEKALSDQIQQSIGKRETVLQDVRIGGGNIIEELQSTRSQPNLLSNLKSDTYLARSGNYQDQSWKSQQSMEQQMNNPFESWYRQNEDHDASNRPFSAQPLNQEHNNSIRNQQYLTGNNENSNNLGESFGLDQKNIKFISPTSSLRQKSDPKLKKKTKKPLSASSTLDQFPSKEEKKTTKKDNSAKRQEREEKSSSRLSSKENRSNSWSSGRRGRQRSANNDAIKKSKPTSHSKSPSQNEVGQSIKSETSVSTFPGIQFISDNNKNSNSNSDRFHRKHSKSSQSLEGKLKSHSTRNSITEPADRMHTSPHQKFNGKNTNPKPNFSQAQSPSPPPANLKNFAEKKRANGEKIKELFKKKKQYDSNSVHQISQSTSQQKISAPILEKKPTQDKKKK